MLTPEQKEEFLRTGIVRMPGAIASDAANEMCDTVWSILRKRYGFRRKDPATWKGERSMRIAGTRDLGAETFPQIGNARVCAALDDLLGPGNWQRPTKWGSLLFTFPESREPWEVPYQAWHLDFPALPSMERLFAVRVFTCLAELSPGGGGTLFVAGSHRLVDNLISKDQVGQKLHSADVRRALIRRHPWVQELCSRDDTVDRIGRFMNTAGLIDDIEVRVVEMTGVPGDVMLVHPLIMHAGATNCASVPRMVLSSIVYRAGVNSALFYDGDNASPMQAEPPSS